MLRLPLVGDALGSHDHAARAVFDVPGDHGLYASAVSGIDHRRLLRCDVEGRAYFHPVFVGYL